jgi:diaminohydroxyphosphoribosylaminopyrimidine deaminase / 5-amino-6-(5-phosphoribosylamino)uracil reductase
MQMQMSKEDIRWMKRALKLAPAGEGWVNPNPLVGAVLVKEGQIIGEGYHEHFGGPHAEVNAIANAQSSIEGSTLYLTLEPCIHQGKTPPCAPLIAEKGITRVVIALTDPNPLVNGKGADYLRKQGIRVDTGIMENVAARQNEVFIKYITTGLPFVILKTAMTLDGKIATVTNASRWITGETSRRFVHRMRNRYSAVMVGIDTVIYDDPMLNCRLNLKDKRDPLKVIVDSKLRLPLQAKVLANEPQLALVATTKQASPGKIKEIERTGAQVIICPEREGRVDLVYLVKTLGALEIDSIMIEGGSTLAFSALKDGLIDKVVSFVAPKLLGGEKAPSPLGGLGIENMEDAVRIVDWSVSKMKDDLRIEGWIQNRV